MREFAAYTGFGRPPELLRHRSGDTQAQGDAPEPGRVAVAIRRTAVPGGVDPAPAPDHAVRATLGPRRIVRRRLRIVTTIILKL